MCCESFFFWSFQHSCCVWCLFGHLGLLALCSVHWGANPADCVYSFLSMSRIILGCTWTGHQLWKTLVFSCFRCHIVYSLITQNSQIYQTTVSPNLFYICLFKFHFLCNFLYLIYSLALFNLLLNSFWVLTT